MTTLYEDIRDAVYVWTNRSDLVVDTDLAIKQALRKAHRSGTFFRDLRTVTVAPIDANVLPMTLDLSASCPGFKQLAYVKNSGLDVFYKETDIRDLFDYDKVWKQDIMWCIGTNLMVRPSQAVTTFDICYYVAPTTTPITSIDSWIANLHQDLIILWAAATVLAFIGEQEVKNRVEAMAKIEYDDMIASNITLVRR